MNEIQISSLHLHVMVTSSILFVQSILLIVSMIPFVRLEDEDKN